VRYKPLLKWMSIKETSGEKSKSILTNNKKKPMMTKQNMLNAKKKKNLKTVSAMNKKLILVN